MPSGGTSGLQGRYMFNFFKNCQSVFQTGYAVLHSYQKCMRVLVTVYLFHFINFSMYVVVFHHGFNFAED